MLLNHTTERIIKVQEDVIYTRTEKKQTAILQVELIVSYGFGSSIGYTNYKQQCEKPGSSQNRGSFPSATTIIPLSLTEQSGNILWNNRTPQFFRFCRPLKLEYTKETKDVILKKTNKI